MANTTKAAPGAKTVRQGLEHTAETLEQMTGATQERVRETMDRSIAAVSEMGAMGKENMEALIASATATSKGIEALSQRAVAYSKTAMENHVAASRAMMSAKSVQELVERQSEYARSAFDSYVAELNKMSDLMTGMTKDALKPLNERMTAVSSLMQGGLKSGLGR